MVWCGFKGVLRWSGVVLRVSGVDQVGFKVVFLSVSLSDANGAKANTGVKGRGCPAPAAETRIEK